MHYRFSKPPQLALEAKQEPPPFIPAFGGRCRTVKMSDELQGAQWYYKQIVADPNKKNHYRIQIVRPYKGGPKEQIQTEEAGLTFIEALKKLFVHENTPENEELSGVKLLENKEDIGFEHFEAFAYREELFFYEDGSIVPLNKGYLEYDGIYDGERLKTAIETPKVVGIAARDQALGLFRETAGAVANILEITGLQKRKEELQIYSGLLGQCHTALRHCIDALGDNSYWRYSLSSYRQAAFVCHYIRSFMDKHLPDPEDPTRKVIESNLEMIELMGRIAILHALRYGLGKDQIKELYQAWPTNVKSSDHRKESYRDDTYKKDVRQNTLSVTELIDGEVTYDEYYDADHQDKSWRTQKKPFKTREQVEAEVAYQQACMEALAMKIGLNPSQINWIKTIIVDGFEKEENRRPLHMIGLTMSSAIQNARREIDVLIAKIDSGDLSQDIRDLTRAKMHSPSHLFAK